MAGGPPTPDRLMDLIAQDKKVKDGMPALVLVRGIGEAFVERAVEMDNLQSFLTRKCSGQ
jgi:3-dehydroquinate synthetase